MNPTLRTPAAYRAAEHITSRTAERHDGATDSAAYTAGYQAGDRWAEALASFTDLEQLEAEALAPFIAGRPFLRGFADGALAAWARMTSETVCTA